MVGWIASYALGLAWAGIAADACDEIVAVADGDPTAIAHARAIVARVGSAETAVARRADALLQRAFELAS